MNRANSKNQGKKITIPKTNSQKATINTLENIKNFSKNKTLENNTKKLSKKVLEEKFSKNKMLVALRARPLLPRELEDSNYKTISVLDAETVSITIPTEYISSEKGKYYFNNEKNIKVTKVKEATFKFDFAFDSSAEQVQVYQYTTANLVQQVINGYNATVFAYGATGTGKTYTMVGEGEKWGIMVRAISDLFKIINQDKDKEKKFVIKISYVEIYNEIIKDLLVDNNSFNNNNKPQLEIRTDAQKGVVLQGASFKKVTNESDAYKLIMRGNKHRTEKPSTLNENSSRSHAILQIYLEVEQQQNSNNINFSTEKTFGKFVLVDLAGSEKAPIFGKKNTESGSINKSLLALGKCITALTSQNKGYIPWRDSKLTRLLQEPLSGNSRIVMIATVSPAISSFDETMFTLQNANKAKGVKVVLKKNVVETEAPRINKYDEYIQNLQEEIHEINEKIVENEKINVNNTISNNNNINTIMNTSKREIIEQPKSKNASNNNLNINIINNNTFDSPNKNVNPSLSPSKKISSNNNTLNNTIQVNECEKIQKEIMEHFQTEINLKKKIIEKEEIIENLKNELSEKEYEFFHSNKANHKLLKGEVETKREDIKEKTKKINKGYVKQNELVAKRKEIQASISRLSNSEPNNPQVKNLFNIYRYYLNLLENMNTEHRKFISINEIKRREKKIGLLTEQLDLRDMYIRDAYKEIELNKCDFNYKNPKIISSEEIDLAPARPPVVRISPSYGSLQNLSKHFTLPKSDNNETDSKNKLKSKPKSKGKDKEKESDKKSNKSSQKYRYSVKSEKYKEMLKEQDSLKKLDEIKKNLVQNTKISKKRQFGNEILGLFKYNPRIMNNINNNQNGIDMNLFERKKHNSPNFVFSQSQTLINAGEKAMNAGNNIYNNNNFGGTNKLRNKINFRSNNNSLAKDTRKNYNFRYDGNGNLLRNKNTRNINNYGNYSFSRDDSMSKSTSKIGITNTSSLENEVQKKVKTILKKDYIGRYKRSPYLRLFEQ